MSVPIITATEVGLLVMAFIGIGGWALLGAGKNRTYALTKDPYWMDYYLFALGPLGILFLGGGFYSLVRTDMYWV